MGLRVKVIIPIAAIFLALSPSWAGPEADAKIAEHFTVRWSSIRYDRAVVLHNPEISSTQQELSEGLSLACEIEIRDPNLVLGTAREGVITQLTDGKNLRFDIAPPSGRLRQSYEYLHYRDRFTQPPKVPRWRAILRSALRLPKNTSFRPQLVTELQPNRLQMHLDKTMLDEGSTEVRRLEGYFHALMAESLVHVDVPFEPNDNWVPLTPELAIQVREAHCDGSSYRLRIEARPRGGNFMRPLSAEAPLPGRIVIARQLIGPDGEPKGQHQRFARFLAPVVGSSSGSGRDMWIETIRFVIAVNPTSQKVPFELKHIPLPHPGP